MSYTTFEYGDLVLTVREDRVVAQTHVTNTGPVAGQEVVQLYSHAVDAPMPTPLRRLQGFDGSHWLQANLAVSGLKYR